MGLYNPEKPLLAGNDLQIFHTFIRHNCPLSTSVATKLVHFLFNISFFFSQGNPWQEGFLKSTQPRSCWKSCLGAEVRPRGRVTRAGHTDCCSRSQTPVSLHPATRGCSSTDFFFFFKKSSTQHNTHSRSGFRRKEDWQGGHGFSHGLRNKASSATRAGLRRHLFDKGLCHPPAPHAPLPGAGQSSQFTWSKGGTRLLSRRHPYRKGQTGTRKHSPCRELHVSPRCHRAPLSLNPAHKRDALFPQG